MRSLDLEYFHPGQAAAGEIHGCSDADTTRLVRSHSRSARCLIISCTGEIQDLSRLQTSLHNRSSMHMPHTCAAVAFEDRMEKELNAYGVQSYQSVALEGLGVFATLRAASKLLFMNVSKLVR